eukprot:scaffold90121_cov30-Tisochrysis_lutea.AAC.15
MRLRHPARCWQRLLGKYALVKFKDFLLHRLQAHKSHQLVDGRTRDGIWFALERVPTGLRRINVERLLGGLWYTLPNGHRGNASLVYGHHELCLVHKAPSQA